MGNLTMKKTQVIDKLTEEHLLTEHRTLKEFSDGLHAWRWCAEEGRTNADQGRYDESRFEPKERSADGACLINEVHLLESQSICVCFFPLSEFSLSLCRGLSSLISQ